ncbi:hypothetical protein DFH27DRAFT_562743 [Peziza echinospora]|nr:hypothetical protein DFH27DRAFT_562743 [Peziza echinospora]
MSQCKRLLTTVETAPPPKLIRVLYSTLPIVWCFYLQFSAQVCISCFFSSQLLLSEKKSNFIPWVIIKQVIDTYICILICIHTVT